MGRAALVDEAQDTCEARDPSGGAERTRLGGDELGGNELGLPKVEPT
jgi:hypothetical protein